METIWTTYQDDLGPSKILLIYDPRIQLRAFVVVDNVSSGPSIGGIRMAPDVSIQEVVRLARAMTLKNAAAGLAHGGGKAGIVADPTMPAQEKEALIRAFGRAIETLVDYIPGPDMGTDETCMAYLRDEIGRSVGLPLVVGGIPLDVIGATGFGLAIAGEVAQEYAEIDLKGARVAIQGFGAVGQHAAHFLAERGAILVGASDVNGAITNPAGLDVEALRKFTKEQGKSVAAFEQGTPIPRDELLFLDCDIWIPAARPDVITTEAAHKMNTRLILQGANIPATLEAEKILHERGIVCVPDFIANAGGVICAAVEYHGGTQGQAFSTIEEKIRANTQAVLRASKEKGITPRDAANEIARARVKEAMTYTAAG
ncbi:MAG: Glu/Leu/Phe/Val dehydrogenase [Myxococcales bacterium]|nr:Glu/Leu/Phe/Val dehydrogenase [Myxococcales bacterium]